MHLISVMQLLRKRNRTSLPIIGRASRISRRFGPHLFLFLLYFFFEICVVCIFQRGRSRNEFVTTPESNPTTPNFLHVLSGLSSSWQNQKHALPKSCVLSPLRRIEFHMCPPFQDSKAVGCAMPSYLDEDPGDTVASILGNIFSLFV